MLKVGQEVKFRNEEFIVEAVVDEQMGCVRLRRVGLRGGFIYLEASDLADKPIAKVQPWQRGR